MSLETTSYHLLLPVTSTELIIAPVYILPLNSDDATFSIFSQLIKDTDSHPHSSVFT